MHDDIDDDGVLATVTQAPMPLIATDQDFDDLFGEDEPIEDLTVEDPRVAQLEVRVAQLTSAELGREQRRVHRKVKAATGGAGLVGVIPIVLQVAGALHLDPELASAIVGAAAVAGAFVAGWVTPERQSQIVSEVLQGS